MGNGAAYIVGGEASWRIMLGNGGGGLEVLAAVPVGKSATSLHRSHKKERRKERRDFISYFHCMK